MIDENLSYKLAARLNNDFQDTVAVARLPSLGEGAPDTAVWEYAKEHGLTLLTKDKDFVDYWKRFGPPPKVIRLEIGNSRLQASEALVRNNKNLIFQFINTPQQGLLFLNGG
nr:DUF5615 family PIN-like protein [Marinibactrum halimedae]